MQVLLIEVIFNDVVMKLSDIPKLRGYFANQFSENTILHNHLPGGKFCYKTPQVQYRVIDEHPALIGFKEGIKIIQDIFLKTNTIVIQDQVLQAQKKMIRKYVEEFGYTKAYNYYRFDSPWMALKQENFKKYITLSYDEKNLFLSRILRENLKTLSKAMDYTIPNIEDVHVFGNFKSKKVNFKDQQMTCFKGEFMMNFLIPSYLGLGKQVARGFGVIKRIKKYESRYSI